MPLFRNDHNGDEVNVEGAAADRLAAFDHWTDITPKADKPAPKAPPKAKG